MKAFPESRRGPIVLDTGPLLTYLALRYLDSIGAKKAYRDVLFREVRPMARPFGDIQQESFGQLMTVHRPALTTPHVMAEVTKLREYSGLARVHEFREFSLDLLAGNTITETSCSVEELRREMGRDFTLRLGLTDAGLILLADRNECLLLADDSRLYGAYSAGARCEIRLLDEYLRETS